MKINPRVNKVQPEPEYRLCLTFTNGEERIYDVRPLLDQGGVFSALIDESAFRSCHVWHGTVQWAGGQDICPDTLYEDSIPVQELEVALVREPRSKYRTARTTKPKKGSRSK